MTVTLLVTRRPHPALDAAAREPEILQDLDKLETMPTMSASAVQAMVLMNDPMAKISSVAELVRRDSVIAAGMLKLANTWAFRGKKPIEDVHQAVMRLGLRECSKLITAIGMRNLYTKYDRLVLQQCDALLQHSFFTACLATGLNRLWQLNFGGEEFTAGLLHDIGRLVQCVRAPMRFLRAEMLDQVEDTHLLEREREQFKVDHCAIGLAFARKNDLPPAVSEVIGYHHTVEAAGPYRDLVALVAVADRIANYAQREHRISDYMLQQCPGFRLLSTSWSVKKKAECQVLLSPLVVKAMKETRSLVKSSQPGK